jgi:hypothetical protein
MIMIHKENVGQAYFFHLYNDREVGLELKERTFHSLGFWVGDPRSAVDIYCRMDLAGARLGSDGFVWVRDLVLWPDEPGWDAAAVVEDFELTDASIAADSAEVSVKYTVAGRTEGDGSWCAAGAAGESSDARVDREEVVRFRLRRSDNAWKIYEPIIPPHVSVERMTQHVERLVESHRDSDNLREYCAELEKTLMRLEEVAAGTR